MNPDVDEIRRQILEDMYEQDEIREWRDVIVSLFVCGIVFGAAMLALGVLLGYGLTRWT